MVASNVKEVLTSEMNLLEKLIPVVAGFAPKPTGNEETDKLSKDNLHSWERDLSGFRDVNGKLANMGDAEFRKAMDEEIGFLENMKKSITGSGAAAQYWKDKIDRDIALSKRLTKLG
jgi:hypothetical protein